MSIIEYLTMLLLKGHRSPVLCVAYSPDGRTLASGSWDQTVKLWDLRTGRERTTLQQGKGAIFALAFSPDGRNLAVASELALTLWDAETGEELQSWGEHSSPFGRGCRTLAFHPDGRTFATEGLLWGANRRRPRPLTPIENLSTYSLVFTPEGDRIVAGCGRGGRGEVLTLDTGARNGKWQTLTTHQAPVFCVAVSPDGRLVASGSGDGTIKLRDLESPREREMPAAHPGRVLGLAFMPDGRTLASASADGLVKLWDTDSGRERAAFDWDISSVRSVAFAPDGMTAAAGGFDNTILVWDIE